MTGEPEAERVEAVAREMYAAVAFRLMWAQDPLAEPSREYLEIARWHLAEVAKERLCAEADARAAHSFANNRCREKDAALADLAAARDDLRALAAVARGHVASHTSDAESWICETCKRADAALSRPGVKAAEGR